jgi:hypothetical protein
VITVVAPAAIRRSAVCGDRLSVDIVTMTLVSELPVDGTHDVIRRGGEVVVPIAEYQRLRQAAEEQQVNDEFDVARAEYLACREAGTIRYLSYEEAGRRLSTACLPDELSGQLGDPGVGPGGGLPPR